MSAFFVGTDHINALLTAAQMGEAYVNPLEDEGFCNCKRMSDDTMSEIGRELIRENIKSLAHRYPGDWQELMPEGFDVNTYRFEEDCHFLTRHRETDGITLAKCYDYQACEHPDYEKSFARDFIQRVVWSLAGKVPQTPNTPSLWEYHKPANAPIRLFA